ncbi:hypothetical protein HHE03_14090 [Helicobacter heilmannii]|nr:hypothetical protein HHE03_14090 [Helicobacter heilmannii]
MRNSRKEKGVNFSTYLDTHRLLDKIDKAFKEKVALH